MSKVEDYLKKNMKGILFPIVKDVLKEKPIDLVNNSLYKFIY